MGKSYATVDRGPSKKKNQEVHPIWRAVGLAMILLIPFLSYVGSLVVLDENRKNAWFALPRDLIMNGWSDPLLVIKLTITIAIAFLLYAVFSLFTFILMRIIAPPRMGPYDAPRVAFRGKPSKR